VPFNVIGVPFRRDVAASSAPSVAFSFIHTKHMPVSALFPVSPLLKNALRRPQILALTINRAFSSEVDAGSREENASKQRLAGWS
jgi:hypothetical protein